MPALRARSVSPSRMRGRSASPSRMRGRSGSPSRMRGRSGSPSRVRGRSGSPSRMRGRSGSPSRMRGRSSSPSRMANGRGRSASPSRMRGRSNSPSRMRGRSNSPSRMTGRSSSPGGRSRTSVSPSEQRRDGGRMGRFRRGGKRRPRSEGDAGKDRRRKFRMAPKRLTRSVRRIAPKESCPCWKIFSYLIPIVVLLACSAGLIVATGNAARFTPDFIENLIPNFDNSDLVDPFSGTGVGTTSIAKWDNGGTSGLNIDVLNAMSSSWERFFSLAVTDWEYGNPDSLSLNTQKVAEEEECAPVNGKIKVCNGDYGETKWRGINSASFDDGGFIIASAARMNEYYLFYDEEDAKQYTLCHELGHAFGLAHTDEIFGNEDLGNCLDYTDNFEVNKHPDVSNYEALLDLYGPVGDRRWLRPSSSNSPRQRDLSPSLWQKMHDEVQKLAARLDDNAHEDGWKLLHRTRHGEEHELEFDGGYKVRVHMLLA